MQLTTTQRPRELKPRRYAHKNQGKPKVRNLEETLYISKKDSEVVNIKRLERSEKEKVLRRVNVSDNSKQ